MDPKCSDHDGWLLTVLVGVMQRDGVIKMVSTRGMGMGAIVPVTLSGPLTQIGTDAMTFEADLAIPAGMVAEMFGMDVKVTVTGTQGGSAITISQIHSRLTLIHQQGVQMFDSGTLVPACYAGALMQTALPTEAHVSGQVTDTTIAAGSTAYTGRYKIPQGLGSGNVHVKFETVNLAALFAGWSNVTSVTVQFYPYLLVAEDRDGERFLISGEAINSTTKASIADAVAMYLIGTATMAGITVNGLKSLSASEMQLVEDLSTLRLPSGDTHYVQYHFFGVKTQVQLTKASAFSCQAIVVR